MVVIGVRGWGEMVARVLDGGWGGMVEVERVLGWNGGAVVYMGLSDYNTHEICTTQK